MNISYCFYFKWDYLVEITWGRMISRGLRGTWVRHLRLCRCCSCRTWDRWLSTRWRWWQLMRCQFPWGSSWLGRSVRGRPWTWRRCPCWRVWGGWWWDWIESKLQFVFDSIVDGFAGVSLHFMAFHGPRVGEDEEGKDSDNGCDFHDDLFNISWCFLFTINNSNSTYPETRSHPIPTQLTLLWPTSSINIHQYPSHNSVNRL